MRFPALLLAFAIAAPAQWRLLDGHTDASMRGIVNVGKGVVWASGTRGTVIHSTDDGTTWQNCAAVPGAGKLDFRGIQAWDNKVAIVMSVGTGDDSRVYRTTDSCRSWKLVFTNPDPKGFWDAHVLGVRNLKAGISWRSAELDKHTTSRARAGFEGKSARATFSVYIFSPHIPAPFSDTMSLVRPNLAAF